MPDTVKDYTPIDLEQAPLGTAIGDQAPRGLTSRITSVEWRDEMVYLTVAHNTLSDSTVVLQLDAGEASELINSELNSGDTLPEWLQGEAEYRFFHAYDCDGWPLGGDKRTAARGRSRLVKGAVVLSDVELLPRGLVRLCIGEVVDVERQYMTVTHHVTLTPEEIVDLAVRLLRPEQPTHLVTVMRGAYEGHLNGDIEPLTGHKAFHEERVYELAERVGFTNCDEMFLLFTPLGEDSGAGSADIVGTFQAEAR